MKVFSYSAVYTYTTLIINFCSNMRRLFYLVIHSNFLCSCDFGFQCFKQNFKYDILLFLNIKYLVCISIIHLQVPFRCFSLKTFSKDFWIIVNPLLWPFNGGSVVPSVEVSFIDDNKINSVYVTLEPYSGFWAYF